MESRKIYKTPELFVDYNDFVDVLIDSVDRIVDFDISWLKKDGGKSL